MKALVCGGRDYHDFRKAVTILDKLRVKYRITHIIAGEAKGADAIAKNWAKLRGLKYDGYHADWDNLDHPQARIKINRWGKEYNANAGPIRNQQMLDEGQPDIVIAFPGGAGTADMKRRSKKANLEVIEVDSSKM